MPQEYLNAILRFAAQAPSSYNFQPWRFVVIQDEENRKRVKEAAYGQPKVGEAPVILVAFSVPSEWKEATTQILEKGRAGALGRALGNVEDTREGLAISERPVIADLDESPYDDRFYNDDACGRVVPDWIPHRWKVSTPKR